MCRWVTLVLAVFACVDSALAQTTFPYDAVVEVNDVYVRSGPGDRFYPTGKLKQGTKVRVIRKDFGGWLMILPPPGSFSWIRAEYIDREGQGSGVVNTDSVVVRVGSSFSDIRDVEQRRLSRGDRVEILDEATLDTDGVPIKMFKIRPPEREYRWISGQAIVPLDGQQRASRDTDPYQIPSNILRSGDLPSSLDTAPREEPALANAAEPGSDPPGTASELVEERPLTRFQEDSPVRRTGPDPAVVQSEMKRLAELDSLFRTMVRRDTSQWEFGAIEQGYRELGAHASSESLKSMIEIRFPALEKFKRIKREYDEFVVLTRETEQRDAQLLSMQKKGTQSNLSSPSTTAAPDPNAAQSPATPADPGGQPDSSSTTTAPRFIGAGVVQRYAQARPGQPQFVLTTPDGRLLAYLQAEGGLDLNRYLGQAMGIDGRRWYRADLRSDFILVRGLTPVRLRTRP